MAWQVLTSPLKELYFEYNGVVQKLAPINPCVLVYAADMTYIAGNPYGNSMISHTEYDGTAEYAAIAAAEAGTLDILALGALITTNNTTAYLYGNNRSMRIEIKRVDQLSGNIDYELKLYMYGTTVQIFTATRRSGSYQNQKFGLVFVIDEDNRNYALWYQDTFNDPGWRAFLYADGTYLSGANRNVMSAVLHTFIYGNEGGGGGANPYSDGGTSEPSGDPTGDYDDTSDVISVPSVPSFNLGITSLINVWVPSTTDINNLAAYLWSNFDLTDPTKTLSKMFTDPLSYILSLHMLPFTVDSSTAITVTLAGLATTVSMPPATVQFKDIDCGSVTINEYWGNYLDYTYTKIVLCLPFCGQVDLDPDEVMGKTIKVKYRVDIITGAFVCFVYIDGDKVLGQYAGNCAAQIPISAADFSRLNAAVLGVAGAAASAFGSAALGGHGGMLNGASGGLISSIAANSQNAKVRAQHSGGLTGAPGFMGIQKPYLIIHRPRQSVPEDYEQFKGYPSNVTMQLSSCTGFTSVREIKLNGLPFTDGELSELKSILEGGVIL